MGEKRPVMRASLSESMTHRVGYECGVTEAQALEAKIYTDEALA
jgi:hypothetical protein